MAKMVDSDCKTSIPTASTARKCDFVQGKQMEEVAWP